jgi:hypothetical protein
MPINGQKINSAISPDKMKKLGRSAMYTAAVDVASLPGKLPKWIIDQKHSDPSKNIQELIVSAKIQFGG